MFATVDLELATGLLIPVWIVALTVKRLQRSNCSLRKQVGILESQQAKFIQRLEESARLAQELLQWYEETFAWDQGTTWHVQGYFQFEKVKNMVENMKLDAEQRERELKAPDKFYDQ